MSNSLSIVAYGLGSYLAGLYIGSLYNEPVERTEPVYIHCYKQTIDDNSMTMMHRIKCPEKVTK